MTTEQTAPSLAEPDVDTRPVEIRMGGPGRAAVVVDGQDLAEHVAGFELVGMAGGDGIPQLVLHLSARDASRTRFDGYARVVVGEQPDPGPAAAAFLDAIDPKELERAALHRDDLDPGEHGLTKAMLTQLKEWASGRA